jgi:hypothetical protein
MTKLKLAGAALVAALTIAPAHAADNAMKVCGAKYQAAKTAKTLPAGQTWNQYLAQCRTTLPKAAPAAVAAPAKPAIAAAPAPAPKAMTASTSGRTPTAGQQAMYTRERQCGAQWKADKAAGKVPAGQTWPQYWSACNKRLK